jgi:hypothetical protein
MFRPTSAQSSLFEANNYFPGALPDDDWSFVFKVKRKSFDQMSFFIKEELSFPLLIFYLLRHFTSLTHLPLKFWGKPNFKITFSQ